MKAKCPYCPGEDDGCDKCGWRGYVEVGFMEGEMYTSFCHGCNETNGGAIVGHKSPFKNLEQLIDRAGYTKCIWCESQNIEWVKL